MLRQKDTGFKKDGKKGDNMKLQVDGIPREERPYFKDKMLKAIEGKGNVYFALDKAMVETVEGYLVTEETLIVKSRIKKAVKSCIEEFRRYMFGKS